MRISLNKYLSYEKNYKSLAAGLCLSILALVVYMRYFDVLAPYIPDGSVRYTFGVYFFVPVLMLVAAQTLFITYLIHVTIIAGVPEKKDALRAYLVAAVQIFLFSMYYVLIPFYGPYTYMVYFTPNEKFPVYSIPLLIVWTVAIIAVTFLILRRTFGIYNEPRFGSWRILILAGTMLAIAIAFAAG